MCSALTGEGIEDIWDVIGQFREQTTRSGIFEARRKAQALDWMHSMTQDYLRSMFYSNPQVAHMLPQIESAVASGQMSATSAVQQLVAIFEKTRQ
jgi:LAO/AO transport system kinase